MQMFWSFWKMWRYPCFINKYRTSVCVYSGKTFWNKNGHFDVLNPVSSLILRALKKSLINSSLFHLHFLTFTRLQGALINYVWSPIILYTWRVLDSPRNKLLYSPFLRDQHTLKRVIHLLALMSHDWPTLAFPRCGKRRNTGLHDKYLESDQSERVLKI